MLIIPAVDILDGNVVRLSEGKYDQVTNYKVTPLEQIKKYKENGFDRVHIVDLTGSKDGKIGTYEILKELKEKLDVTIEFGGGIRSREDIANLLEIGVDKIIVGSMSIKDKENFEKVVKEFGPDKFVVAADVKDEIVFVKGWTEDSNTNIIDHISYCKELGLEEFLCTDIATDGMLQGPGIKLYEKINSVHKDIKLIASGGVSCVEDLEKLSEMSSFGVVVGKAIYEGRIKLEELANFGK